jgi:hypothetical protein
MAKQPKQWPILRLGTNQPEALALWRDFLGRQGIPPGTGKLFSEADGAATREFQARQSLVVDGIVGPESWGRALELDKALKPKQAESDLPQQPQQPKRLSDARCIRNFGTIEFEAAPTPSDPDAIRITNDFVTNIVKVSIPELRSVPGARNDGIVEFHTKAADRLQRLFRTWGQKGLMTRVLTFHGSFVPRFIRPPPPPGKRVLSRHAWGVAFDINRRWNLLGQHPARRGEEGCVYDLIEDAAACGFYWGGFFKSRQDGMHFEVGDNPDDWS